MSNSQLPANFGALIRLKVWRDYGPIGRGASQARFVRAENGQEYLIKGPSLVNGHPYVATNELISVRLAQILGLPVLGHVILEQGADLFFGSEYMQAPTFYQSIDQALFTRCANQDRVYGIVVLDIWLRNRDRHHENLIVRRVVDGTGGAEELLLVLNDHSHCPLEPGTKPRQLADIVGSPVSESKKLDFLYAAVADQATLISWIEHVEGVSDDVLSDVVQSTPEAWLERSHHATIVDFLKSRRNKLRSLIIAGRGEFPNLGRGIL